MKGRSKFLLAGPLCELFRSKPSKRNSSNQSQSLTVAYETLEERKVLASLFPTYIDGQFTFGDDSGASPYALEDTFKLESRPNATKTIYLDFDGFHSVNNSWGHDIVFPAFDRNGDPSTFSDSELIEIQLQFQNVAEDFLPFDVNVTTMDPGVEALRKSDANDQEYGIRDVNTQATDGFGNGIGGVAFLNSFDDSIDNPVFSFNKGENNGAMTSSHEVGHALGLRHDGLGSQTYHPGVGSGEISWGPIMGAPFGENITQWSNGDYNNSTNTEDDYSIITKPANGFGFRADDHGSSIATASQLDVESDFSVFDWGIIERNTDNDYFQFETGDGQINLNISAFGERPNIDIEAKLWDANGTLIATSNPANSVDATFTETLTEGTYYVSVDGVANANMASDYGSIGFFTIDGQLTPPTSLEDIGESGVVNVNHNWVTVELENSYVNPVVVMGPASRNGGHQVTVRVDDVTSDSFRVVIDEWDYLDGTHLVEQVSYIVLEAGIHELADGTIIQAGNHNVNHRWANVDFEPGLFESTPLVFSQTTSFNDAEAVATRARNIDTLGFQVRLQEEQGNGNRRHLFESVGWFAIEEAGVGQMEDGSHYEANQTGDVVTHRTYNGNFNAQFNETPIFIAAMQTFNGGDVATVRQWDLDSAGFAVDIEEEQSFDKEVSHNAESVGFFAFQPGILTGRPGGEESPQSGRSSFDGYDAGTNNEQGWAAYQEMVSWGEDTTPLGHDECHDHGDDTNTDAHEPGCGCAACMGAVADQDTQKRQSQANFFNIIEAKELKLEAAKTEEVNVADQVADLSGAIANPTQAFDTAFEDLFSNDQDKKRATVKPVDKLELV